MSLIKYLLLVALAQLFKPYETQIMILAAILIIYACIWHLKKKRQYLEPVP